MGVHAAQCRRPTQASRGFRGQSWSWPVGQCGSAARVRALPGARTHVLALWPPHSPAHWPASGGGAGAAEAGGGGEANGPLGCWQFQGKGQDSLASERKRGREQCKDES